MLGVREQEANQLLSASSIALYAIAYVALFALPLFGSRALRSALPAWVKLAAVGGLISSAVSLVIAVYPIVDVTSSGAYAAKICGVVLVTNLAGVFVYRAGHRRARLARGQASVAR